jgi:hypothetical protein
MNKSRYLNQDNLPAVNKEYQGRTYEDLSSEFQKLYPSAVRAFELIALMYNRLTLVENLRHKEAVAKIENDHKHLAGFSKRNISRSLPLDNPKVPRRVRPQWRKNSDTESNTHSKLSYIEQGQGENAKLLADNNAKAKKADANLYGHSSECPSCVELSRENHELKEVLEKNGQLTTANNIARAASASINENHNVLEFEFYLLKQEILDYLGEPYLWLKDGDSKVWFSCKVDRKNGRVISAKPGRLGQQQQEEDLNKEGDMQNE